MSAANTRDCFRECVGKTIKGVLFDAVPFTPDIIYGTHTLVFDDGSGLTIGSNGRYWQETPEAITRAISVYRDRVRNAEREAGDLLEWAGSA